MKSLETMWQAYIKEILNFEFEKEECVEIKEIIILKYRNMEYGKGIVISKNPCKIQRIE